MAIYGKKTLENGLEITDTAQDLLNTPVWVSPVPQPSEDQFVEVAHAGGRSKFDGKVIAPAPVVTTPTTSLTPVAADKQTVVILDTGIGTSIANLIYQYDFYANDNNAKNTTTSNHGSIVAKQVLAADADVNLVMLKVAADGTDSISMAAVDRALDWVVSNAKLLNIAAVNMSFGAAQVVTSATTTEVSDEYASLKTLDVAVVVAAGNAGSKVGVSALASDVNAIAVSASNNDGIFASFSNRDADLTDLVADGVNILAPNGTLVSGTSFSAPLVAGAISEVKDAFYTAYGRELTVVESLHLLQSTADAMSTTGEVVASTGGYGTGYGQLDLGAALDAIQNPTELALIGIVTTV